MTDLTVDLQIPAGQVPLSRRQPRIRDWHDLGGSSALNSCCIGANRRPRRRPPRPTRCRA